MAYSDYGGYAYRNSKRVEERSDAVLSSEGVKSTPGMWPGFLLPEGRNGGSYHALLGDGPVFVGLYKQSTVSVHLPDREVDLLEIVQNMLPDGLFEYEGKRYLDSSAFRDRPQPTLFEVEGHRLEVFWREEDNFYVYARLTQPSGVIWTGFSGYGVGAGLEDCGYGFSTTEREGVLAELFADAEREAYEASEREEAGF